MRPSQMGTHTSDKRLFQKGLKKSLTKKRLPPHCQGFFGTSHHTKRVQKKPSHTKRVQKSLRHWRPMRPSQTGTHTSDKALFQKGLKKPDQKKEHLPPHCQCFFGTSHHTKRVQKSLRTQKGPKKTFDTGGPWGQVKWEPIRLTPAPTLPSFFWDVPPRKNGPKKAFDTGGPWGQVKREPIRLTRGYSRKVWKKAWPKNGTPAPTAKVFLEHPTTQKGSKKSLHIQKGSKKTLRHWRPMRPNGNSYVWQGTIPERSEKKLDQKTEHLPPHCQGFFWNVPPHKKGPKKAFTHKKMRPSQMGTHTSDTCPHTAKVFLGRPTTQKGSKKSLRTQKVQKKPQVGTHTSDKGLSQKGLKKAWPEPTTRKGSKKSLRKQVGKKALTSKTNAYSHTGDTRAWVMVNHRKGSKKSPAGTEKNPARTTSAEDFAHSSKLDGWSTKPKQNLRTREQNRRSGSGSYLITLCASNLRLHLKTDKIHHYAIATDH